MTDKVKNPLTGRPILINGPTFKKLVKDGIINSKGELIKKYSSKKSSTKKSSSKKSSTTTNQPSSKKSHKLGKIRVTKYHPSKEVPKIDGYTNIIIHTSGKVFGGQLSPYILKDEKGRLLENIWQFSKIYKIVTAQNQKLSRYQPKVITWNHPEEIHVDSSGKITNLYWEWREKGMNNWYAIRYPNGFKGRHTVLYSLWEDKNKEYQKLNYIEARKKIYCGEYARLAPKTEHFKKMKKMISEGKNLQILEVDGPEGGLDIDEKTIREKINDPAKPFGHGYTIAALLLDGEDWMK